MRRSWMGLAIKSVFLRTHPGVSRVDSPTAEWPCGYQPLCNANAASSGSYQTRMYIYILLFLLGAIRGPLVEPNEARNDKEPSA